MKKRLTADRIYLIVTGLMIQMALLIPWIPGIDGRLSVYTCLAQMKTAGELKQLVMTGLGIREVGMMEWSELEPMAVLFRMQLYALVILQVLGLINILMTFGKKKRSFICVVNLTICAANVFALPDSLMFSLDGWLPKLYLLIILVLQGINLIGYKMIDSWAEATEEQRQIREHEREVKKERKERLAFEGKYSRQFYHVIWKNFRTSWETYRLFILVGGLSVGFIFSGMGMEEILSDVHGADNILMGQGLGAILFSYLAVAIVISVFLIVSVLLFYLKNHVKNYALFINLGMRSKTLYLFVGIELLSCIILSFAGGVILGNLILVICRAVIQRGFDGAVMLESITIKTYLLTLLVSFLVYLVSAMATHDVYIDTGASNSRYKDVMKEKMPGKLSPIFLILGAVILFLAVTNFARRERAEELMLLGAFFIGLYLLWKNSWNLYLRRRKKKNQVYFKNLLKKNYFYHHFKTVFRYLFLITLLHVSVLFIFGREVVSSKTAQEPAEMFPYDYVCMATEEEETFFKEMEEENDAEVSIYPMVRVTSVDNSSRMNDIRECMQPQGQNIGISKSTYKKLCENSGQKAQKLDLAEDGSEVFLFYQEDRSVKAHPIDYFPNRTRPYLHIGQPLLYYNFVIREKLYPPREIAGMESGSLIGALRQGEHENIVVFSDEYFAKVQDAWKTTDCNSGEVLGEGEGVEDVTMHHWPDRLVLMNVSEEEKTEVEEKLKVFGENHAFDVAFDSVVQSWYSKDELVLQMQSERFMNRIVSIFIIAVMLIVILVLLYMKAESEMEEKKKQQEFLECMGMREKDRLQVIKSEVWYYFQIPYLIASITVMVFTAIMWKIRLYKQADCIAYMKVLVVLYLVYGALQALGIKGLERFIIRKVEGRHERNDKDR